MDLDDGSRFGLPPIGLPQANMGTPGSDTERRQTPAVATKGSVFAWNSTLVQLCSRSGTANFSDTINIRNNTATNGSSADVPTWAAGAVVLLGTSLSTLGALGYYNWQIRSSVTSGSLPVIGIERNAVSVVASYAQAIVPFYDEPLFVVEGFTDTALALTVVYLLGFVRNV